MTQPPNAPDPNQPPYGGQPAYGGQQGYGSAPPAGYGGAPAPTKRPGAVTAAAVIAFVSGGLNLLGALLVFAASDAASEAGVSGGLLAALAIIGLLFGAALIWGGLQAMNGKDQRVLVVVAAAAILLQLITWVTAGFDGASFLSLVLPVVIISLLVQQQSKQWFQSRGAPTFSPGGRQL